MTTLAQRSAPTMTLRRLPVAWFLLPVLIGLAGAMVFAFSQRPQLDYDVDLTRSLESSPFDMTGVYAVEGKNSEPYRWTRTYAFLQVRNAFHLAPAYVATLTVQSDRPDGPQPVTMLVNEQPVVVTPTTRVLRTYHVLLPHQPDDDGSLRFATTTKILKLPNDARELGFITTRWILTPLFNSPALGPLTSGEIVLVVAGGLILAAWLWWRAGWHYALSVAPSVALALMVLRLFYQPMPLPFTQLALITLIAVALLPWLTRIVWSAVGLSIITLVSTFSGTLWQTWITDDALISFRYAQNFVVGNGLVYNVGERVEGYTNFLWTILAALVIALGGDPIFVSYYVGVVIALCLVAATFIFARRFLGEGWALAAAMLLGTSHSLFLYTSRGSGLETGLFALLVLLGSYCFVNERLSLAGTLFALATLTRPEGVLLLAIAGLIRVVERRKLERDLWGMVGAFAVIVVPFVAWRFTYYGDLLPNTFYAKTGGGAAQVWRGLQYAWSFGRFTGGPVLLILLSLAAVTFIRTWRVDLTQRRWQLFVWSVVSLYTAYIIAVGGDHFPGYRFFVPILPFVTLLMAVGARRLGSIGTRMFGRIGAVVAIAIVVGLGVFNLTRSTPDVELILKGDDTSVWFWRELGWWFAEHGGPGESMAALGAGAIPYYSDRPTVDLLGLNDKHIARLKVEGVGTGTAGHEKRDPAYVLNVRKPTYIPGIWAEYFGGEPGLKATGLYQKQFIVTRHGRRVELWQRIP